MVMVVGRLTLRLASTLLVVVSIREMVLEPVLVTNSRVPSGVMARSLGLVPTVMVAITVGSAVVVSITDTVPAPRLVTYKTVPPPGLTATALGEAPTVMVAITELEARSITDTVPAPSLVT